MKKLGRPPKATETKVPVNVMMLPSTKKKAQKRSVELKVSVSEYVCDLVEADNETS